MNNPKVLMVCLGNICRSPLAEGILKSKLKNTGIEVASAGTSGWHIGQAPHKMSIEVAKNNGIDISYQKGRKLKLTDLDYFTHIYAMDISNYQNIIDLCQTERQRSKVRLILKNKQSVPDPYGHGFSSFEKTFNLLDVACTRIVKEFRSTSNI